ncbi:MAG: molybdopterin-dependent oxidoreductase, partial [Acidobacteriota bacterium]
MSTTTAPQRSTEPTWQPTACILCSLNCGLEVQVADGHLAKIRGDRAHPVSQGYQCQKASRLDFYQNGKNRLASPLRRREDGSFEEISWDQAIREVAAKLRTLRDTHGGHTLAYYGGGGQGNHMGGAYSSTLRAAMGTRYIYNSLAQEKTGGFWVNGELFGRQTCHPSEDVEHADFVLFIGTNPWQSHGFPQARKVLNAIARDPERTMVVVDPRRTETAKKADIFLQVRPGGDAWLMLAMLGTIVQENLEDQDFLDRRTTGWPELRQRLRTIDVDAAARRAGVDADAIRDVARGLAAAERGCVRTDLGLEHSPNSTLNTYLSKLLFLVTGQFGKPGTVNLHAHLVPLIGHSKSPDEGGRRTRVTGMREISKFYPPNILPAEIDTDHPERLRGLVVDSANPLMTAADTHAYRRAFAKLDLLVVIDVAMTETARHADYVLPASSQFEKWEATFFNLEFPTNFFHLRPPVVDPAADTLTEQEIYRRIAVAMDE